MATSRRTRILIVDDSAVMRSLLRTLVSSDTALEVSGTAADGASALGAIETLRPDLVLLDVEMPVMDGLSTVREMRRRGHKMPVIMVSSLTGHGARVTLEALASGASDYVTKPARQASREDASRTLAQDLLPKIHALAPPSGASLLPLAASPHAAPHSLAFPAPQRMPFGLPGTLPPCPPPANANPTVLAIGVSTGGPAALEVLLPALPADFPLPVLIVQHMPELFTSLFAERLNARCPLHVREAAEGEPVRPGGIFIARGNWHLEVLPAARSSAPPTLHLTQGPLENHCRPAVDVLFRSTAAAYRSGVLAVVLTGMGSDGLAGARAIRAQGGAVLAQDQASSTVWGMPGAVTAAGLAQKVLPLNAIASEILRLAARSRADAPQPLKLVV